MPRTYLDRMGRPITDPESIEAQRIFQQARRLITLGVKAGRPYDEAITVGELAKTVKRTPAEVVAIIRDRGYLWCLTEIGPVEDWWIVEDGE